MTYYIASDIHGSAAWCERMLADYRLSGADRLILLGDLLYHGPRNELPEDYAPKRVAEMLNGVASELICVRGNCDSEVDQMMLSFPILADYAIIDTGDLLIFATHGHRYNLESLPPIRPGDVLLHGHTHVPADTVAEGIRYVNPGSVSIPKNGSPHRALLLKDGDFIPRLLG